MKSATIHSLFKCNIVEKRERILCQPLWLSREKFGELDRKVCINQAAWLLSQWVVHYTWKCCSFKWMVNAICKSLYDFLKPLEELSHNFWVHIIHATISLFVYTWWDCLFLDVVPLWVWMCINMNQKKRVWQNSRERYLILLWKWAVTYFSCDENEACNFPKVCSGK